MLTMEGSISRALCALVFICQLFCYGGADICEDRSTSIKNGNVECTNYDPQYSSVEYTCTVNCVPGYVEKPAKEINCNSKGISVWKIDEDGHSAKVYYGTWMAVFSEVKCEAPKTCPNISAVDKPQHGRAICSTNINERICMRTCKYPYEVTEPEFLKEHCGPDTNFFWSHVLRHNSTKMFPCALPRTCRPLQESDMPHHGHMVCKKKEWANSVICELHCERGYIYKRTSKAFEFCGPTTAYIWSHLHAHRNSSARIAGCEQPPITTEVIMRFNRSCDMIDSNEINPGVDKIFGILNLTLHNVKLNVSLISWRTDCHPETQHEEIETIKNSNTHEAATASDMIFSFHLKVNCKYGKCTEACAMLGISMEDNRCLELCKSKAGPANKQVRHLVTSYTHRIIEAIDVSTASHYLPGTSFKLLNVTSKDSDNYRPSDQDVFLIEESNLCTVYSINCHDKC